MKRKHLPSVPAIIVAMLLLVGGAFVHGRFTNRWGQAADTLDAAKILESLPKEVDQWQVRDEIPLGASALSILQCEGFVNRIYFNRTSGEMLGVTVLLGPPGPMTVHTPEICFPSRDYLQAGQPERLSLRQGEADLGDFYRVMFRPTSPSGTSLEVLYGWHDGQAWQAPDTPRFAFGGRPHLFKIQIVSQLWPNVTFGENGVAATFLRSFVAATSTNFTDSAQDD